MVWFQNNVLYFHYYTGICYQPKESLKNQIYGAFVSDEATGNNFTCRCSEGFEGSLCDTPYCRKQHCENGYCNTTTTIPVCQCQVGFEGKFCEINIDDCILPTGDSACQNGGVCIDGIGRYNCNCTGTGE